MRFHRRSLLSILVSGAISGLTACSGGGGSGGAKNLDPTLQGMAMPERLTVVTAKADAPPPVPAPARVKGLALPFRDIAANLPTSGAYVTDTPQVWVNDDSIRALGTVNMILCMVAQTRAADMVNVNGNGQYVALVNEDKCDQEKAAKAAVEAASSQGTSANASTSTTVSYNRWTVESTRASDTSPQIVKAWIPGKTGTQNVRDGQQIMAKITITEPVSADKPFGSFEMLFEGYIPNPAGSGMLKSMRGNLRTVANNSGQPQFEFINLEGGLVTSALNSYFSGAQKAAVILNPADNSGQALSYQHDEDHTNGDWSNTSGYVVAFDQDYYLRGTDANGDGQVDVGTTNICTERNGFDTQVFQYNVYDTNGDLLKLNSGFPFHFSNSALGHGNIGYWGVWTEKNLTAAQIANQTIVQESWSNSAPAQTYTLKVSPGRLQKRLMHSAGLADIQNLELSWWGDPDDAGVTYSSGSYIAVYDGSAIKITKSVTWNPGAPPTYADVGPITLASDGDGKPDGQQYWFYSDALGGSVNLIKNSGAYDVVYYAEEWLSPGAVLDTDRAIAMEGAQLVCRDNCPKGTAVYSSAPTAYNQMFYDSGAPRTYTLHTSNGVITLTDDSSSSPVDWSGVNWSGLGSSDNWLANGARSGFMVLSQDDNNISNYWDVNAKPLTFAWQMGSGLNNNTITAVNNGTFYTFDKPMRFNYSYAPLTDDYSSSPTIAAGALFMLEYGGPGQLSGFPWQPADPACTSNCQWKSAINLRDGVVITDAAGSTQYLVRGMQKEQRMAQADLASCAALNLNTPSFTLPSSVVGTLGFSWSDKPNVTAAPAVIEGQLQ